jgi:hypothetical protein
MKIIYKDAPLPYISNNRPERVGSYNLKGMLELENSTSNDGYLSPVNSVQSDDSERWVAEDITMIDNDFCDWFLDWHEPYIISRINKLAPAE